MSNARPQRRGWASVWGPAFFLSMVATSVHGQTAFEEPEQLTDGSKAFQLSRNPNTSMDFDSEGRLHIVYWSGSFATTPDQPSFVYYQNWTPADGWSSRQFVDDSFFDTGTELRKYGGRHPSLAIAPDDTVWVAWHDHRHSNPDPPGNGINNIEVYADRRPPGGTFSSTDIRLTDTAAAHLGDNGYLPRIAASPSGRISVLWYDFHENGNVSDIFVTHSDPMGDFGVIEPILTQRITNQADRPGTGFTKESYSVPDLAVDGLGNLFAVWTSGFGGVAPVYFAAVPDPPSIVSETPLAAQTGAYFDPAKITTAANGDLWVVYTRESAGEEDVVAVRRRAGASFFDAPLELAATPGVVEKAGDLEVDANGRVHAVWIDERAGRHVYYARFDPDGLGLLDEQPLTTASRPYGRVTLALDGGGQPYVLFDAINGSQGDVWFVAPAETTSVARWTTYQ